VRFERTADAARDGTETFDPLEGRGRSSKSKWGWTGGAGVEQAITQNWSAKLEYDFLLFGTERYTFIFQPFLLL